MIVIDEQRIFDEIQKRKPVSVALNGPDGILPKIQETASKIMERFGIPAYVLADSCFGTCDMNTNGAKVLGAEILFHIGHTVNSTSFGDNVVLVDAFDNIPFDSIAEKCAREFRGKTVSLVTDSQHLHEVDKVRSILELGGVKVLVGKGKGQLNDGQVFGCEFYPVMGTKDSVDANVFLGQSNFHAAGVALSTGKPTHVLDPYFNEIREVTEFAQTLQKKSILAVYKAAEAESFGIIVGLKEGQFSKVTALKFRKELESLGKKVQLFALTDITDDKLRNLKGIDAFIQVACPRISTDNHFHKPVLSTPQANALIRVLKKESPENIFQIQHWL
ncbi:MAG TPA: diphthamide biosynthesis enzyme Dph2 [Candidatus Nitrosotalea sp.]|nr:diphthamide biosynthesis enzyme Dph2 [Candidatus Nitrosotalea sp.]